MPTLTAKQWKAFYANERIALGERGLDALFEKAPKVKLPENGALVFPHTRLSHTGELVAAVARAVVESGAPTVRALGVLHGAREQDREQVEAARAGDATARKALRRMHGPYASGRHWVEEFSLDGFEALLERAAARSGRPAPKVMKWYPFLVGDDPVGFLDVAENADFGFTGMALGRERDRMPVVATTDPIHHGRGYETPVDRCMPRESHDTVVKARASIEKSFQLLSERRYADFQAHTLAERSDFRDVGPVLMELRPFSRYTIHACELVPYGDVLGAPDPTWVAGALVEVQP
ncbi:MAG: hypothetical protein JST54_25305 [Deltaproteobacteria bacterium]|nr:hypothetical protein [Deltaproteobacteria bacterium]